MSQPDNQSICIEGKDVVISDPLKIHSIGFTCFKNCPNNSDYVKHRHPELEILISENADHVFHYHGQDFHLEPGQAVLFWAIHLHGNQKSGDDCLAYGLRIPMPWVLQWDLPIEFVYQILHQGLIKINDTTSEISSLKQIKSWVHLMQRYPEQCHNIVLPQIRGWFYQLALENRSSNERLNHEYPKMVKQFDQMVTMIVEKFREPIQIKDVAETIQLHPDTAKRIFKKVAGMTIHEFIVHQRVEYAKRLLFSTDKPVNIISEESGFGAQSRLYAAFEKWLGCSPGAYRKNVRKA